MYEDAIEKIKELYASQSGVNKSTGHFVLYKEQFDALFTKPPNLKQLFFFLIEQDIIFIPIPEKRLFGFMMVGEVMNWRRICRSNEEDQLWQSLITSKS